MAVRKHSRYQRKWLWAFPVILFVLMFCMQVPVWSGAPTDDEMSLPFLEKRYTMGADFILALNVTSLDYMLNYPGSTLRPVTQVRVMYFQRDPQTKQFTQQGQLYEDLWYSSGRPIGCRRYMKLPVQPGAYGAIALLRSKDAGNNTRAADNLALRLFCELSTIRCSVTAFIMPLEYCDNAGSDLGSFGFYNTSSVTAGRVLLLHLSSTPYGFDKYFQYTVK